MDEKFIRRFESFKNSLDSLAEARQSDLFRSNLITGDELIEKHKVKNQLAHDYDGVIVKEHCQTIIHEYIDKLYDFKTVVETLLKEDK